MKYNWLIVFLVTVLGLVFSIIQTDGGKAGTFYSASITPTSIDRMIEQEWHEILQPTDTCVLPCWWDISPGKITLENARLTLQEKFPEINISEASAERNGKSGFVVFGSNDYLSHNASNRLAPLHLSVTSYSGVVSEINFGSPPLTEPGLMTAWGYFDIATVIHDYTSPSAIKLAGYALQGEPFFIYLGLYWQEKGIIIYYIKPHLNSLSSPSEYERICFGFEYLYQVEIKLLDVNSYANIEEMSDIGTEIYRQDIRDVFDLTNQEFLEQLFDNNGCLPSNIIDQWVFPE